MVGVILAVNVAQQLYFCKQIVNAVSVNVGLTHEPDAVCVIRIVVIVIGVVEIVARCIVDQIDDVVAAALACAV